MPNGMRVSQRFYLDCFPVQLGNGNAAEKPDRFNTPV